MDKESLQKRLAEIEKAIEQSMANLNMLMGGKQEILYWLGQVSSGISLGELKEMTRADSIELVDKVG